MVTSITRVAIAIVCIVAVTASDGPQLLPDPDLEDGYSLAVTERSWKAANEALDPGNKTSAREVRKAWLILRLPEREGPRPDANAPDDLLPQIVVNASTARARRIKMISETLQGVTYEPASFQRALRSTVSFTGVQAYRREDYLRLSVIAPSIEFWIPHRMSGDGVEVQMIAEVLETFRGIAPIFIIFDDVESKFEVRVPHDAHRLLTTVFGSNSLRRAIEGGRPELLLVSVWDAVAGNPRSRVVDSGRK